jgi:hypothetical protein
MWLPLQSFGRVGLFLTLGVLAPWIMAQLWARQRGASYRPTLQSVFNRGELGLVSLGVATAVIWDVGAAPFSAPLIYAMCFVVAAVGISAAVAWVVIHCRAVGLGANDDAPRTFRESRNLAFLAFSVALVTEILLEHARWVR